MGYLPIFLDVTARRCLVVGGGALAERKVAALLEAGAAVTVLSPRLTPSLVARARARGLNHLAREYRAGDLRGAALVILATDDKQQNREIAAEARASGIPINVVDEPELCTFIAPAVVSRGALQVAISTGGASPAMAARIRRELEHQFGPEYGLALEILRAARKMLRSSEPRPAERAGRLRALAGSELLDHLKGGDLAAIDRVLLEHLGASLESLDLAPSELGLPGRTAVTRE